MVREVDEPGALEAGEDGVRGLGAVVWGWGGGEVGEVYELLAGSVWVEVSFLAVHMAVGCSVGFVVGASPVASRRSFFPRVFALLVDDTTTTIRLQGRASEISPLTGMNSSSVSTAAVDSAIFGRVVSMMESASCKHSCGTF